MKTAAPLLLPDLERIFVGDAKCKDIGGSWPASHALNCTGGSGGAAADLVAVQHPQFETLSLADEFSGSVERMRLRQSAPTVLDEIAAHLDAGRRAALFEIIDSLNAQAIMTGTDAALFSALSDRAQFFRVSAGTVTPEEPPDSSTGKR